MSFNNGNNSNEKMIYIEKTCVEFSNGGPNRPNCEQILMDFKNSPNAIEDSVFILTHSQIAFAQFHAITTLRENITRKWNDFTAQDQRNFLHFFLDLLYKSADGVEMKLEKYVLASIYMTTAVLFKRGYLTNSSELGKSPTINSEEDEKMFILQLIKNRMEQNVLQQQQLGNSSIEIMFQQKIIAVRLFLAIITEFAASATKSTNMNLPLEFHIKTREVFTREDASSRNGLFDIAQCGFTWLQELVEYTKNVSEAENMQLSNEHLELLSINFELCVEVLNWDFRTDGIAEVHWGTTSDAESNCVMVKPHKVWNSFLIQPALIHSSFQLYVLLRHLPGTFSYVPHLCRQLFIQLSSLQGDVFLDKTQQIGFLGEVFKCASQVIQHPLLDAASCSTQNSIATNEIYDFSVILLRLVSNLKIQIFFTSNELALSVVQELSGLSCKVLDSAHKAIQSSLNQNIGLTKEEVWEFDSCDVLLEAWSLLLSDPVLEKTKSSGLSAHEIQQIQNVNLCLTEYSKPVIEKYIQVQLAMNAVEVLEEEDEDEEEEDSSAKDAMEQLELASVLGRINVQSMIPYLNKEMKSLVLLYQHEISLNASSMSVKLSQTLEQLHWLLLYSGIVLADPFEGERPSIPFQIQQLSSKHLENNPVSELTTLIFQLLDFESQRLEKNPDDCLLSPFLSEQLFKTITRVVACYLSPDPSLYDHGIAPSLLCNFEVTSADSAGGRLVDFLIQKSSLYLYMWPTQPQLVKNICELLMAISHTRASGVATQFPAWYALIDANGVTGGFLSENNSITKRIGGLSKLSINLRGKLVESLCRSGMCLGSGGHTHQEKMKMVEEHFSRVSFPIEKRLRALVGMPNFGTKDFINDLNVQEEVKLLIEMYSGIAKATEVESHPLISRFCLPVLPVMVQLMEVFHGFQEVVCLVLDFFCNFVEAQVAYLNPANAFHLYGACGELIRVYSKHNLGRVSGLGDAEDEKHSDVHSLLLLLSHLVSKDFIDFSDKASSNSEVENATVAVSDVVFFGLSLVIPLMSEQLLQYRGLCSQYFTLVSFMVEIYPKKVSTLEPKLFTMVIESLVYGIKHVESDIVRYSLQALSELAAYQLKSTERGQPGLITQCSQQPDLFVNFIKLIFHAIIFDSLQIDLLDTFASALFPLLIIEKDKYHAIAQEFSAQQTLPNNRDRFLNSFAELMQFSHSNESNELCLNRKTRSIFKSNLQNFVSVVRGFVQLK